MQVCVIWHLQVRRRALPLPTPQCEDDDAAGPRGDGHSASGAARTRRQPNVDVCQGRDRWRNHLWPRGELQAGARLPQLSVGVATRGGRLHIRCRAGLGRQEQHSADAATACDHCDHATVECQGARFAPEARVSSHRRTAVSGLQRLLLLRCSGDRYFRPRTWA